MYTSHPKTFLRGNEMTKNNKANEHQFIQLSGPARVNITIDFYRSTYNDFQDCSNLALSLDLDKISTSSRNIHSNTEDKCNEID